MKSRWLYQEHIRLTAELAPGQHYVLARSATNWLSVNAPKPRSCQRWDCDRAGAAGAESWFQKWLRASVGMSRKRSTSRGAKHFASASASSTRRDVVVQAADVVRIVPRFD